MNTRSQAKSMDDPQGKAGEGIDIEEVPKREIIVVTWNMQGARAGMPGNVTGNYSDAEGAFFTSTDKMSLHADVVLFQEAGNVTLPAGSIVLEQEATFKLHFGYKHANGQYLQLLWWESLYDSNADEDEGAEDEDGVALAPSEDKRRKQTYRCNFAVCMSYQTAAAASKPPIYRLIEYYEGKRIRPMLGVFYKNIWIYTVHAPSTSNTFPAKVVAKMLSIIPPIRKYVCAGDFNCTPEVLAGKVNECSGLAKFSVAYTPGGYSHINSGRLLDYMCGTHRFEYYEKEKSGRSVKVLLSDHIRQSFKVDTIDDAAVSQKISVEVVNMCMDMLEIEQRIRQARYFMAGKKYTLSGLKSKLTTLDELLQKSFKGTLVNYRKSNWICAWPFVCWEKKAAPKFDKADEKVDVLRKKQKLNEDDGEEMSIPLEPVAESFRSVEKHSLQRRHECLRKEIDCLIEKLVADGSKEQISAFGNTKILFEWAKLGRINAKLALIAPKLLPITGKLLAL